jgi:hypothetical protein
MSTTDAIDTLEYIPRDVSLAYTNENGDKFYISPLRDIIGGVLRRSPSVISKRLEETQRYRQWQFHEQMAGRSYDPLFPWDEELLFESDIAEAVRSAIKKKEHVYALFDKRPNDVFPLGIYIRGDVLSASVKSKGRQKRTRPTEYTTNIISPYLSENSEIQLKSAYCKCDDFAYGKSKKEGNFLMRCLHQGALSSEFYARARFPNSKRPIKGKMNNAPIFLPFAFTQNYIPNRQGGSEYINPHLAALEYDAFMTYYCMHGKEDKHFGIDRRLFTISEIYTPALMNAIRTGKIKREIVGQRPAASIKDKNEINAEMNVFKQMASRLRQYGYRPEGKCLELGGNVAIRYENGENAVSIVFGEGPMYYVQREGIDSDGQINPFGMYDGLENAISLLGCNSWSYDDRTMRETGFSVELPSAMRIPETGDEHISIHTPKILRDRWRNAIAESFGPDLLEGKLKYARLLYD